MKIIFVAWIAILLSIHAYGQAQSSSVELDTKQRLEAAKQLVVSTDAADKTSSTNSNIWQAQNDSYQKSIDKFYPNLDALTRLRVLKAWDEVAVRHIGVFDRMFNDQVDLITRKIASKYSLLELQQFLELSRGKKSDALGLLTNEEMKEIQSRQLVQIGPDIERMANDFMALHFRLIQQGVLPK